MSEFEKEYKDLGFRAQVLDAVLTDKDIICFIIMSCNNWYIYIVYSILCMVNI